jgi:hypothetical protein
MKVIIGLSKSEKITFVIDGNTAMVYHPLGNQYFYNGYWFEPVEIYRFDNDLYYINVFVLQDKGVRFVMVSKNYALLYEYILQISYDEFLNLLE